MIYFRHMKIIAVGSLNPVKINAVHQAFSQVFPDNVFDISGYPADSGVSDQPMGSAETLTGARNRVAHLRARTPAADYYVGIEGGIEAFEDHLIEIGWMVIEHQSGTESIARTASLTIPEAVAQVVRKGKELGHAVDEVFKKENSKHETGLVGILTNGLIMRSDYYVHTLVLALVKFISTSEKY